MRLIIAAICLMTLYFTLPMLYAVIASMPLFPAVIYAAPLALLSFGAVALFRSARR